jgi:hypothetical protein
MLSLLFYQIIITLVCLWSGILFYKFFPAKNKPRPIIYYLVSGLILLTSLTQIIVLFFPITIYTRFGILGLLILLSIIKRKNTKFFLPEIKISPFLILFFIVWTILLLINAGPTMMDDTESYHIQSIKWIQEYGSVPGLVNLHERFGLNSSWFSSVALFSFSSKTTGGFTVMNSVISVWLCYWFIEKFNQFKKENNVQAAFAILSVFIVSLAIWALIRGNAATTNYDFITTSIGLILFTDVFFSEKTSPSIEWIIWPAYLLTVRVINFPLLLLSLFAFILFIKQKQTRQLFLPVVYCFLLIVPFLIRNIIVAGYPFYPATLFDFTNVDWKPDPLITERFFEFVKYYNRVSTTYFDIEQTKALGSAWVPAWFEHLFPFDKILVLAGFTGILFTGIKLCIQKNNYNKSIITGLMILWLISWFIIAPDPRWVYGVLLFGIFLLTYHLICFIKDPGSIKFSLNALIILMIAGLSYYLVSKPLKQTEYRNWISPLQLPQPPVKEFVIDGITFRIPEIINNNWNMRCYGTELPCLYEIHPRLKPRGKNIGSGFHLEKSSH